MLTPIGIDVGPAKGGHICSGSPVFNRSPCLLEDYLAELSTDVLIAWDAPLTACAFPNGPLLRSDLTLRMIEQFLRQYGIPEGISVQPYMSCSHWTITRRMLGLPRVGRYDCTSLPFSLITSNDSRPSSGRHVVEVHPAVALYFWFKDDPEGVSLCTRYKQDYDACLRLWDRLRERFPDCRDCWPAEQRRATCHDSLDAVVAWLLAKMWLARAGVHLLGNASTGAMLLPADAFVTDAFQTYASRNRRLPATA